MRVDGPQMRSDGSSGEPPRAGGCVGCGVGCGVGRGVPAQCGHGAGSGSTAQVGGHGWGLPPDGGGGAHRECDAQVGDDGGAVGGQRGAAIGEELQRAHRRCRLRRARANEVDEALDDPWHGVEARGPQLVDGFEDERRRQLGLVAREEEGAHAGVQVEHQVGAARQRVSSGSRGSAVAPFAEAHGRREARSAVGGRACAHQKPITWKKGVKQTVPARAQDASNGSGKSSSCCCASQSSAACVCGTALGVPVVPPVKKTAAVIDEETWATAGGQRVGGDADVGRVCQQGAGGVKGETTGRHPRG
eukprot:3754846-Prymnesium_polylepis.1